MTNQKYPNNEMLSRIISNSYKYCDNMNNFERKLKKQSILDFCYVCTINYLILIYLNLK